MTFEHVARVVFDEPWAILPSKLNAIAELVRFRMSGERFTTEEIQARVGGVASMSSPRASGSVGVLPLYGVVTQRADMMSDMSGGTSTDRFAQQFQQMLADPNCSAIVIDVDSPGGSVYGVDELASLIYNSRGSKPIVAVANAQAASAAYWIATAADELVVTPSGEVGSIGVICQHVDESQALAAQGVTVSTITAGKYKGEGNSTAPLSDEARAAIQSRIDDYYSAFTSTVARNRSTPVSTVRSGFGQGRMLGAKQAVAAGMADSVGTLDQTIARLMSPNARARVGKAKAEDEVVELAASEEQAAPAQEVEETPASDTDMRRRRLRFNSTVTSPRRAPGKSSTGDN